MAILIPDEKSGATAGKFAPTGCEYATGSIRVPCQNEPRPEGDSLPLPARLRPIMERYRAFPDSGEIADKTFFDDLSGNL